MREAVLAGLSQTPKVISARWLYDAEGSRLFEAITRLPEYYPTRVETALLAEHAPAIAAAIGPGRLVIEFGSGSSAKTPLLLAAVDPVGYIPVDIAPEALAEAATMLRARFPSLEIRPLVRDFMEDLALPPRPARLPALGFFPGSTIGNLAPAQAVDLLRRLATGLGPDSQLLIGIDPPKDLSTLHAAYDDRDGVTARFNRNLLVRLVRELGATLDPALFRHEARWNVSRSRIEMHLVATEAIRFSVAGKPFAMAQGESIHTENSHKWDLAASALLARAGCWEPKHVWTDPERLFTLQLWARASALVEP